MTTTTTMEHKPRSVQHFFQKQQQQDQQHDQHEQDRRMNNNNVVGFPGLIHLRFSILFDDDTSLLNANKLLHSKSQEDEELRYRILDTSTRVFCINGGFQIVSNLSNDDWCLSLHTDTTDTTATANNNKEDNEETNIGDEETNIGDEPLDSSSSSSTQRSSDGEATSLVTQNNKPTPTVLLADYRRPDRRSHFSWNATDYTTTIQVALDPSSSSSSSTPTSHFQTVGWVHVELTYPVLIIGSIHTLHAISETQTNAMTQDPLQNAQSSAQRTLDDLISRGQFIRDLRGRKSTNNNQQHHNNASSHYYYNHTHVQDNRILSVSPPGSELILFGPYFTTTTPSSSPKNDTSSSTNIYDSTTTNNNNNEAQLLPPIRVIGLFMFLITILGVTATAIFAKRRRKEHEFDEFMKAQSCGGTLTTLKGLDKMLEQGRDRVDRLDNA